MTNLPTLPPKHLSLRPFLWRLLTLGWAATIFQLSTATFGISFTAWLLSLTLSLLHLTLSPSAFSTLHYIVRKLAHVAEYAIFSLLLYYCFEESQRAGCRPRPALWSYLGAALYSLTDEFHQSFVPGRTASLADCGIDTAGAGLGMLILYGNEWLSQVKTRRAAAKTERTPER